MTTRSLFSLRKTLRWHRYRVNIVSRFLSLCCRTSKLSFLGDFDHGYLDKPAVISPAMIMSSVFRTSLSKVPLSRPLIQNAQSRTVTTTMTCNVFQRPDIPSPRGLFVNPCKFLPVIPTSLAPGKICTPQDFLKAIGRSSETKISIDSWDAFWRTSGLDMKNAGLSIQDRRFVLPHLCPYPCDMQKRRYILWCMEKFRQNQPVEEFAHELQPKKKIRGCVQSQHPRLVSNSNVD